MPKNLQVFRLVLVVQSSFLRAELSLDRFVLRVVGLRSEIEIWVRICSIVSNFSEDKGNKNYRLFVLGGSKVPSHFALFFSTNLRWRNFSFVLVLAFSNCTYFKYFVTLTFDSFFHKNIPLSLYLLLSLSPSLTLNKKWHSIERLWMQSGKNANLAKFSILFAVKNVSCQFSI